MKLNAEIGAASEHWEQSYNQLRDDTTKERAQVKEDFKKSMTDKQEKMRQLKKKIQEKEASLKEYKSVND
jgi:hypothetical protein